MGLWGLLPQSAFPVGAVPVGSEVTRCGWHYGDIPTILVTRDQPSASEYKRVCKDCDRGLRRRLRRDLVADVVRAAPPLP